MKTIDLTKYGEPHPADCNIRFYLTLEKGREAAEKCGLKEAVLAGPVNLIILQSSDGGYHMGRHTTNNITEAWIKGFVGPTAREVGIGLFIKNVQINGCKLSGGWHGYKVQSVASAYLNAEENRLQKKAEADDRKNGKTLWTEPGRFLIGIKLDVDRKQVMDKVNQIMVLLRDLRALNVILNIKGGKRQKKYIIELSDAM